MFIWKLKDYAAFKGGNIYTNKGFYSYNRDFDFGLDFDLDFNFAATHNNNDDFFIILDGLENIIIKQNEGDDLAANDDSFTNAGKLKNSTANQGDDRDTFTNTGKVKYSKVKQGDDEDTFTNDGVVTKSIVRQGDDSDTFTNTGKVKHSKVNQGDDEDTFTNDGVVTKSIVRQGDDNDTFTNSGKVKYSKVNQGDDEDTFTNDGVVTKSIVRQGHDSDTFTNTGKVKHSKVNQGDDEDTFTNDGVVTKSIVRQGDDSDTFTNTGKVKHSKVNQGDGNDVFENSGTIKHSKIKQGYGDDVLKLSMVSSNMKTSFHGGKGYDSITLQADSTADAMLFASTHLGGTQTINSFATFKNYELVNLTDLNNDLIASYEWDGSSWQDITPRDDAPIVSADIADVEILSGDIDSPIQLSIIDIVDPDGGGASIASVEYIGDLEGVTFSFDSQSGAISVDNIDFLSPELQLEFQAIISDESGNTVSADFNVNVENSNPSIPGISILSSSNDNSSVIQNDLNNSMVAEGNVVLNDIVIDQRSGDDSFTTLGTLTTSTGNITILQGSDDDFFVNSGSITSVPGKKITIDQEAGIDTVVNAGLFENVIIKQNEGDDLFSHSSGGTMRDTTVLQGSENDTVEIQTASFLDNAEINQEAGNDKAIVSINSIPTALESYVDGGAGEDELVFTFNQLLGDDITALVDEIEVSNSQDITINNGLFDNITFRNYEDIKIIDSLSQDVVKRYEFSGDGWVAM